MSTDDITNGSFEDYEQEWYQRLAEKDLDELSDAEVTSKLKLSLKRRFDYPEWVLMFEYGAPGNDGSVCDCLATNTLPSRNYKVVGFELKASRSDWLREKRNGLKNDYFVRMVDEWYLVAPKGVVEESEIPDGWGYLEMKPNSEQLYKIRDSELTEHQQGEPSRRFWVRFVKQTVGDETNFTKSDLKEARSRGYQDAKEDGFRQKKLDRDLDRLRDKAESYDELRERVDFLPFRGISDEQIEMLNLSHHLVRKIAGGRHGDFRKEIEMMRDSIERYSDQMLDDVDQLDEALDNLEQRVEEGGELPNAE